MRRSWWIWSFVTGLAASGLLGYRIVSKSHEISSTQFQNAINDLYEALQKPAKPTDAPASARYTAIADRIKSRLDAGDVDSRNLPHFRYWEGWTRLKGALAALDEAFGGPEKSADPRPETYQNAWLQLERAVESGHLDVPDPATVEDLSRYWKFVDDPKTALPELKARARVLEELGIELAPTGDMPVTRADPALLRRVGVTVHEPDDKPRHWHDIVIGSPLSDAQRDFLASRLALFEALDRVNLDLAQRFAELQRPEMAWQYADVVFRDKPVAGERLVLRGLLGRVIDARRRHLAALAAFVGAGAGDERGRLSELEARREDYDRALDFYERTLIGAVAGIREAFKDGDDFERLRELLEHQRRRLAAREEALAEFDPRLYRMQVRSSTVDEKDLEARAAVREREVDDERRYLEGTEKPRQERLERALEAVNAFAEHLARPVMELEDLRSLSGAAVDDLVRASGDTDRGLSLLISDARRTLPPDEFQRFMRALSGVLVVDIKMLRARAARYLGDGQGAAAMIAGTEGRALAPNAEASGREEARRLGEIADDFDVIRRGVLEIQRRQGDAPDPSDVKSHDAIVDFLNAYIADYERAARRGRSAAGDQRAYFNELAYEVRQLKRSYLDAGFEHAELKYQFVLGQLGKLSGAERPWFTAEEAEEYARVQRDWVKRAVEAHGAGRELPPRPDPAEPRFASVRRFVEMERDYRRLKNEALAEYRTFVESDNESVRRRAQYGIVSLMMDDMHYQYDWKWRHSFLERYVPPGSSALPFRYGGFAFIEGVPRGLEGAAGVSAEDGYWLSPSDEVYQFYRRGPDMEHLAEVESGLARLMSVTPGQDADLYAAVRLRAGELKELRPDPARRGAALSDDIEAFYPGDLPGAIKEFYLPLLRARSTVADETLTRNRYIPLKQHFQRLNDKLQRRLASVNRGMIGGGGRHTAIDALFAALAPAAASEAATDVGAVSRFYENYFRAVAERDPGLLALPEALYDFNFQLGELMEANADVLLARVRSDDPEFKRRAREAEQRGMEFSRRAGQVLFEYVASFPGAAGESGMQLRIGDAFFRSKDYVFAINAYRKYFSERELTDRREERAELYYVANQIGRSYLALGMYRGKSMEAARASGDPLEIRREETPETMTLDGAIPAFEWVIQRTRMLLKSAGHAGAARNRLPPAGALDAFINMARAKYEAGRLSDERLLDEALILLRTDLIEGDLFPRPVMGFPDSLHWRDAQFYIGACELELARRARAKPIDQIDHANLRLHLDNAASAFADIIGRWPDPVNRRIYMLSLREGRDYQSAREEAEAGGSRAGAFTDDVYYLAVYHAAEVDRLRAIHSPDPLSSSALDALRRAQPRLEFLRDRLNAVHGLDRPLKGTPFTFPELSRMTRYLLADTVYLQARAFRNRLSDGDNVDPFQVRALYHQAIREYQDAQKHHPDTYLSAWAYAQILNCRRALGRADWEPEQRDEARRMIEASNVFLQSMSEAAFTEAPDGMRRTDFENFFRWYDLFDE